MCFDKLGFVFFNKNFCSMDFICFQSLQSRQYRSNKEISYVTRETVQIALKITKQQFAFMTNCFKTLYCRKPFCIGNEHCPIRCSGLIVNVVKIRLPVAIDRVIMYVRVF